MGKKWRKRDRETEDGRKRGGMRGFEDGIFFLSLYHPENLCRAVEGEHFECAKMLVLYGALILKDSHGHTPIDISRQRGLKDICHFFDTYPVWSRERKNKRR